MLTKLYCTESIVDFDAYKAIFTHNSSSVMFVFFITVFWFFLSFVEITTSFEINDDQHVTKTKKHVADALKGQKGLSMIYDMLHQHSGAPISSIVFRDLRLMISVRSISADRKKGGRSQTMKYESWSLIICMHELKFGRRTIDIAVQRWIFVEYKVKENVWLGTYSLIQKGLSVMFQ